MTKSYKVLIIEDEPMTIEGYTNALQHVASLSDSITFTIDNAQTCPTAYEKIQLAANGTPFDIVFLDLRLPSSVGHKIRSGEDLGLAIRKATPSTKIIVITSHFDASYLNHIWHSLQPDSFVVKGDIVYKDLITIIEKVVDNKNFFSNRILTLMKQLSSNNGLLGAIDLQILTEISNGAKMKELLELLPLSKSGIEKRRALIKEKFGDKGMSDRDMILAAKEMGFI